MNRLQWKAPKVVHESSGRTIEVRHAHRGNDYYPTFDITIIKQLCPCCNDIASWFVQGGSAVLWNSPEEQIDVSAQIVVATKQLMEGLQKAVDDNRIQL